MGYLALADAFVVTGESASMLAEACTTGKPVAIFPLPARSAGVIAWMRSLGRTLGDAVARRAYASPLNKRGIERPQRGVQRFCAGLLAKGWVRTGGHSRQLHESLIAHGLATYFDGSLPQPSASSVNEMKRVADRVRTMMGFAK
jgi:mitochondrial fission protein ELM1